MERGLLLDPKSSIFRKHIICFYTLLTEATSPVQWKKKILFLFSLLQQTVFGVIRSLQSDKTPSLRRENKNGAHLSTVVGRSLAFSPFFCDIERRGWGIQQPHGFSLLRRCCCWMAGFLLKNPKSSEFSVFPFFFSRASHDREVLPFYRPKVFPARRGGLLLTRLYPKLASRNVILVFLLCYFASFCVFLQDNLFRFLLPRIRFRVGCTQ